MVAGQEAALSVAIPAFMLILAIFLCVVVLSIALFGIIATALQMKENKDVSDKESGKKTDVAAQLKAADPKKSKDGKNVREMCTFEESNTPD